jgi:hypothetical protein
LLTCGSVKTVVDVHQEWSCGIRTICHDHDSWVVTVGPCFCKDCFWWQ